MNKIKLNGAKVPHVAQLHEDPKKVLTQQAQDHEFLNESPDVQKAIDSLLAAELPEANQGHASATSAKAVRQETTRRRIYASSISNTLTNTEVFIATATTCGTKYATSKPLYELTNLQTISNDGYVKVTNVDAAETAYKYEVASRMQEFDGLASLCALVVAEMVMSGASRETVDQLRFLVRKLRGQRKVPKNPNDPTAVYNSVSQVNYDNLVANFERFIMMVAADPNYDPVTDALKVTTLEAKLETLRTANINVIVAKAELDAARIARNEFFNTEVTGLVDVFLTAKNVVLTNFGRNSAQYKQVSGLSFKRIKD